MGFWVSELMGLGRKEERKTFPVALLSSEAGRFHRLLGRRGPANLEFQEILGLATPVTMKDLGRAICRF